MVNENCVASIIAALTQTDSDAWCKRALTQSVILSGFDKENLLETAASDLRNQCYRHSCLLQYVT